MRPSVSTHVILDAAADLVADRGIDRVTMDAIAARAKVAKGVLYLRFTDKTALLFAAVRRELTLATQVAAELIERDPRGGMLSRVFVHSLAALHTRPALLRFYRDGPQGLTREGGAGDPARLRSRVLLGAEFIRGLQVDGLVDPTLDATVLAENLALWNQAVVTCGPHRDLDALILGMAELVARAADTDATDSTPGKRRYARLARSLTEEWSLE